MDRRLPLLLLAVAAALPLLSLWGHPGRALADPLSELPVKLWMHERFLGEGLLSGDPGGIGFPVGGRLNNPDPVGMVVTGALRPLVGQAWAWNLLVWLQTWANAAAVWALVRALGAPRGAVLAGVAFALTPLVLVYCVTGAVSDMLVLWPWPMAIRAVVRGLDEERAWRFGIEAAAWALVGLVACPYHAATFAPLAVPLLLLVRHRPPWRLVVGLVLPLAAGAGAYGAWLRALTEASTALPAELIAATRHAPPFPFLAPTHVDRYTAWLSDFVATGPDALLVRSAGSRYFRAFSPGLVLIALALAGLGRRGWVWALAALWCAVAATGPFLPITGDVAVGTNPVWSLAWRWMGGALLLEPFRYALPAALALAVVAGLGVERLAARWGRWVPLVAVPAWLAELVWVSPVPVPLLTADLSVPAAYARLDEALGPGAVVALPFFDRGTDRFVRVHFLHQLVHDRPIPDQVTGFPPTYLVDNQFTASLLAPETRDNRLHVVVRDPSRIDADLERLRADGVAGVVVEPRWYASDAVWREVRARLDAVATPVLIDGVWIYPLDAVE